MSLQFFLGAASQDLQQAMFQKFENWVKTEPEAKFFYVVPDHIKFESEVVLLNYLRQSLGQADELFAVNNIQIFSFTRLAWYFMKDQALFQRRHLTQNGLSMIVAHILHELDDEQLYVFAKEKGKAGFAFKLAEQLLELKTGGITPSDLEKLEQKLVSQTGQMENLRSKLADLKLVYERFLSYIETDYLDTAQILLELKKYLMTIDLSDAFFMFNGFTHFSALERDILELMLQKAREVSIGLVLPKIILENEDEVNFFKVKRLYFGVLNDAKKLQVEVIKPSFIENNSRVTKGLMQLENYLLTSTIPSDVTELKNNVKLIETKDQVSELRYVAAKIRQLVKAGYTYQDILVLAPDMTKYRNLLQPIFNEYKIPVFIDLDKTMSDHPLVEFIRALFLIKRRGYTYQEMLRLLKTELFIPNLFSEELTINQYRNLVDLLENCILKNGYRTAKDWGQKQAWILVESGLQPNQTPTQNLQQQQNLQLNRLGNALRQAIFIQLQAFYQRLNQAQTTRQAIAELVMFLRQARVDEQLQNWQKIAKKQLEKQQGSYDDYTRPKQVWDAFISLLDEYVIALGDQAFDELEFLDILENGFESLTYARVPSTLDQVIFSQTSVTQTPTRKVTFIIGATDDVFPARFENAMILSDQDRQVLVENWFDEEDEHKFINDYSGLLMADEPFKAYMALMTPSEKLFISIPKSDQDGNLLEISPYIAALIQDLKIKKRIFTAPDPLQQEIDDWLGTWRTTLSELIVASQFAFQNQQDLSQSWRWILAYQQKHHPLLTNQLLQSLSYQNEILPQTPLDAAGHKKLAPTIVNQLYGQQIYTSISQLEAFYSNPYEYFLRYGLRLKPRAEFILAPADTGEFFHTMLDGFFSNVLKRHASLTKLTSQEFDEIMTATLEQLEKEARFKIFNSSARYRYTKKQLEKTVYQVSQALKRQQAKGNVYTAKTETSFGQGKILPPLIYPRDMTLPKMYVQGRIDRIDLVKDEREQLYLNIVDYKSGSLQNKMQDFLLKAYNGISLQLLTYLNALENNHLGELNLATLRIPATLQQQLAVTDDTKIQLGSVAYLQLLDPIFELADLTETSALKKISQKYLYQGLYRWDEQNDEANLYLQALDDKLKEAVITKKATESLHYPLKYEVKSKNFKAKNQSKLLTSLQLQHLLKLNEIKLEQARQEIFAGVIDLAPYKLKASSGLDYSDYQAIMTFDSLLAGNQYRQIEVVSEEEIWEKIEKLLKIKEK